MRKMVKQLPSVSPNARFTVSDAAEILQVPTCRLYVHIRKGKIEANKREIDNLMTISGKEILKYWHSYH